MIEIVWSESASQQLDEITAYIEEFNVAAAAEVGAALRTLAQSLSTSPNRGRPAANGSRELVTVRPYVLRYSVHGEFVLIRSIRHSRRKPLS